MHSVPRWIASTAKRSSKHTMRTVIPSESLKMAVLIVSWSRSDGLRSGSTLAKLANNHRNATLLVQRDNSTDSKRSAKPLSVNSARRASGVPAHTSGISRSLASRRMTLRNTRC